MRTETGSLEGRFLDVRDKARLEADLNRLVNDACLSGICRDMGRLFGSPET